MTAPVIAIRTDYGVDTGLGHLRRCLSLAGALERLGARTHFFVSRDPGGSAADAGHPGATEVGAADAHDLHETANGMAAVGAQAFVLDSYKVPPEALDRIEAVRAILVDHVPSSPLPVDVLINGSLDALGADVAARDSTVLLLGPEYVLLRPEFAQPRERAIRERAERVLVMTGGGDASGVSVTFAACAREALPDAILEIIVGPYFSPATVAALERLADADARVVLHRNPDTIETIMLRCDLALTAGGQTTYELAATGTPAVAVSVADNQTANLRGLHARGALVWAGSVGDPELRARIAEALVELSSDAAARRTMSAAARAVVDGRGAERVAAEILKLCREGPR